MNNERIDLTRFDCDEYDDRFYKVDDEMELEGYMNEDENDMLSPIELAA